MTGSLTQQFWEATVVSSLKAFLGKFQECEKFCDLTLRSKDGLEFKVHKIIMCTVSGFFRDLYSSDYFSDSAASEIPLDKWNGHILGQVVSFIYQGDLSVEGMEDLIRLTDAARSLQLDKLSELCTLRVEELLNDAVWLSGWRLAQEYPIALLENVFKSYGVQFSEKLFANPAICNDLSRQELDCILQDQNLKCDPKIIFKMLQEWDKGKRRCSSKFSEDFFQLLKYVNFSELDKNFLLENVLKDEELMRNYQVLRKLSQLTASEWEKQAAAWNKKKSFLLIHRQQIYNIPFEENKVNKMQANLNITFDFGYTTFNNLLFVCGGRTKDLYTKNITKYFCPNSGNWVNFASMNTHRCEHRCATMNGKIYACGGTTRSGKCSSTEIFDLGSETWLSGPTMKSAKSSFGLTEQHGRLYAISSRLGVEMLDPRSSGSWKELLNCEGYSDYSVQCISLGYDIYCYASSSKFSVFDTRMDKFRDLKLEFWANKSYKEFDWVSFHVCEIDGKIGILFPRQNLFHLLNKTQEVTTTCQLPVSLSERSGPSCLVALYC